MVICDIAVINGSYEDERIKELKINEKSAMFKRKCTDSMITYGAVRLQKYLYCLYADSDHN